jgi:hypothetical protein
MLWASDPTALLLEELQVMGGCTDSVQIESGTARQRRL